MNKIVVDGKKFVDELVRKFDENQWSHTYWSYYREMFESPIAESLVRTVPVAVCGKINSYKHDKKNNVFILEFNQEREFDVPTVIYAHKEIESIETDGEYEIISLGKNGGRIEIRTNIGNHKVTIKFK